MSEQPTDESRRRPSGLVDVRWVGWLLLVAAAVIVLVAVLGLRGTATAAVLLDEGFDDNGSRLAALPVTLSCAAPGHGPTVPDTGDGQPFADLDTVSSGTTTVTDTLDLTVGHACDQVRAKRITHALALGGVGGLTALAGVAFSLVPPWRRGRRPGGKVAS